MNRAYKERIAASKARHDTEMRAFAASLAGTTEQRVQALRERFRGIDPAYALALAGAA